LEFDSSYDWVVHFHLDEVGFSEHIENCLHCVNVLSQAGHTESVPHLAFKKVGMEWFASIELFKTPSEANGPLD